MCQLLMLSLRAVRTLFIKWSNYFQHKHKYKGIFQYKFNSAGVTEPSRVAYTKTVGLVKEAEAVVA